MCVCVCVCVEIYVFSRDDKGQVALSVSSRDWGTDGHAKHGSSGTSLAWLGAVWHFVNVGAFVLFHPRRKEAGLSPERKQTCFPFTPIVVYPSFHRAPLS
jgi:hypothetical protein